MDALSSPQVLIGGQWLSSLATWGDLVITNRWPYGCWEASWKIGFKQYQRFAPIVADAPVQIRLGPGLLWGGNLAAPNWATGEMTAVGAVREGETALCLTSTGETTSTPNLAVDQAIARGALTWTRRDSLSGAAFVVGDTTPSVNYITALMDAWSNSVDQRWAVRADRVVYSAPDPGIPSIYIRPGAGVLGVTDKNQAARIFGRYQVAGTNSFATVSAGSGSPEVGVSLADYGPIDAATATNIITGIRNKLQPRAGWTNGLTVTADQVTNPGGVPMGLDQVLPGRMARAQGLRDERGGLAYTDFVIGETIWNVSDGTVQINPVGLDDQSLSGAVEDAGGELL